MKRERPNEKIQWSWILTHIFFHILCLYGAANYFSLINVGILLVTHYTIMLFGITLGYHRLISHRSYETSSTIENIFALLGCLSFQGGPCFWAAVHRSHHGFTDKVGDAHSAKRGFFWAHQQWLFRREPNGFSYAGNRSRIRDLLKNSTLVFYDKHFFMLNMIVAIFALIVLPIDIWYWIFPIRIVFSWHSTWSVNSFAHGLSPFRKNINPKPTNATWISFLTCGEGLHANHHKNPSSPSFEINQYDFDFAFLILKFLEKVRLVKIKT